MTKKLFVVWLIVVISSIFYLTKNALVWIFNSVAAFTLTYSRFCSMSVIVSVMFEVVRYLKYRIFHVASLLTVSGVVCLQCGGSCRVIPRHQTAPSGVLLQASRMNLFHKPLYSH